MSMIIRLLRGVAGEWDSIYQAYLQIKKSEETVSTTEKIGTNRLKGTQNSTSVKLSEIKACKACDLEEIRGKYEFVPVSLPEDLKSGNYMECPPDGNFKEKVYITDMEDPSYCACVVLKDHLNRSVEVTQAFLDYEIFDREDTDRTARHNNIRHLKNELKQLKAPTVFKANKTSIT